MCSSITNWARERHNQFLRPRCCESQCDDSCTNKPYKLDPQLECRMNQAQAALQLATSISLDYLFAISARWDQYLLQITNRRWRTINNTPLNDHRCSKLSRWWQPPKVRKNLQPK